MVIIHSIVTNRALAFTNIIEKLAEIRGYLNLLCLLSPVNTLNKDCYEYAYHTRHLNR